MDWCKHLLWSLDYTHTARAQLRDFCAQVTVDFLFPNKIIDHLYYGRCGHLCSHWASLLAENGIKKCGAKKNATRKLVIFLCHKRIRLIMSDISWYFQNSKIIIIVKVKIIFTLTYYYFNYFTAFAAIKL